MLILAEMPDRANADATESGREITKYDDVDWHGSDGGAEFPFCHIGMYLTWLIRNRLVREGAFEPDDLGAILERRMLATDLESEVDGTLASDLLTDEGRRFTDIHYEAFLRAWESFAPRDDPYSVEPTEENYERIASVLDRALSSWRAGVSPASVEQVGGIPWDSHTLTRQPRGVSVSIPTLPITPGSKPAGEAEVVMRLLTPATAVGRTFRHTIVPVTGYSARMARVLRDLGADPRQAVVATFPVGGQTADTWLSVDEYHASGVPATELLEGLQKLWLWADRFRGYEGETWSGADVLVGRRQYKQWNTTAALYAIDGALWAAFSIDEALLRELFEHVVRRANEPPGA